jgi:hypothetical protein
MKEEIIKPSHWNENNLRFDPKAFHKYTMIPADVSGAKQLYYVGAIECPLYDALVYPSQCEGCTHGKAGNYTEKWVKCDYHETA